MTIQSEAARAKKIEDLLDPLAGQGDVERIPLPWQDTKGQVFPVIKMPLDHVVLNPGSHRIREQLESHPKRAIVQVSPFSDDGQAVISEILSKIEGFEDLKANLRDQGQQDAGVITRSAVLINANTRAVALRANDPHGYIRVAVLPKNADPKDIDKLELTLQMRRDFKQDYTFVNQLLFVEDLKAKLKYSDEDVAKAMNLAVSGDKTALRKGALQARQRTRLLAVIREIQQRSQNKIPLHFFNDVRVALEELDALYEDLKRTDPPAAVQMKEARILAILVGTQYRHIRSISATSAADKVVPYLQGNDDIGTAVGSMLTVREEPVDFPGLDELADEASSGEDQVPTVGALVDLIAKNWDNDSVDLPGTGGASNAIPLDDLKNKIAEELDIVHEEVVREDRATKSLTGPIQLLKSARSSASLALVAYQKVASHPGFKNGNLSYELKKLEHVVEALKAEFAQHK
jgi:hypothetical protein